MDNSNLNFKEFKSTTLEDWHKAATAQLKGDDPSQKLKWSSEFGISLGAYYIKDDLAETAYLKQFSKMVKGGSWKLLESIIVTDVAQANEMALEALNGGCDGVLFSLTASVDLGRLTDNIQFEHCLVSFETHKDAKSEVESFVSKNNIQGFVVERGESCFFHSDDYSQSTTLENLGDMVVDFAKNSSEKPIIFFRQGQDFFHELARVRAARYLFHRVSVIKNKPLDPKQIWIHCEPNGVQVEDENWFTQSSIGLAGIIGGANSISFDPMNSIRRISRNVGNLIRHESKIEQFNDAALGSYFVDHLTDLFIQHTWSKLQNELGL